MTRLEFNNQVLQLSRKLYMTAFRFLRHNEEAEDAVQEIFIKLWNKRDDLDHYSSLEALATTAIKNHCIDILRSCRVRAMDNTSDHSAIPDNYPTPSQALEWSESQQIIEKIIRDLPGNFRDLITSKEIDCLSYEEIAEITGQNINSLRVSISRARKMIRDEYKKHRYEYTGDIRASR